MTCFTFGKTNAALSTCAGVEGSDRFPAGNPSKVPLLGHLSDHIGHKNMYVTGAAVTRRVRIHLFRHAEAGSEPIIFFAIIVSLVPRDML